MTTTSTTRLLTGLLGSLLAVALMALPATPAQAQNFAFSGFITFSDLSGIEHTLDFEDLIGTGQQDVQLPGYDWNGDGGSNTGPMFHLSCSATLGGTTANVNRSTQSNTAPFSHPPAAWFDGQEVTIVDFFWTRRNINNNNSTECSADQFQNYQIVKSASASEVDAGESFFYTLTVTNTGTGDIFDLLVEDEVDLLGGALAIDSVDPDTNCAVTGNVVECLFPTLAEGGSIDITINMSSLGITTEFCGQVDNVATAVATGLAPRVSNIVQVEIVNCIEFNPDIELLKEISVDGGTTWHDANDASSAPLAEFPSGALYRLTVTNTGNVTLENILINDPTLGLTNVAVGDLDPGEFVVIDSGTAGFAALDVAVACDQGETVVNTATVDADSAADSQTVSDSDPATLVCVGIDVIKEGDAIAKVGDEVDYSFTLQNLSEFALEDCTADDDLLGGIFGPNAALAVGDTVETASRVAQASDPNPLPNEVTLSCDVVGPVNTVNLVATDDHETALVDPGITVTKTGPDVWKLGDDVCFDISFENTGIGAVENCTVDDSLGGALGSITEGEVVEFCVTPIGSGTIENEATVTCDVSGFDNSVNDSDSHSVDVFSPSVSVVKTGPSLAKTGDTVTYTVTLTDTSSSNTPDLTCQASDPLNNGGAPFAIEPGVAVNYDYDIPSDASGSVDNTVTVTCNIAGFDNQVGDSDSHSIDVFTPSVSVDKTGPDLAKTGDTVTYTVTLTDTSSVNTPDLTCTATDPLNDGGAPFAIEPGVAVNYDYDIPSDASGSVDNTVTVTCDIAGFDNQVGDSDSHSIDVFTAGVEVTKTGPDTGKVGDTVTYTITLTDLSSDNTPTLTCTADDSLIGELADFDFGDNTYDYEIGADDVDGDQVTNTVTVTCDIDGFDNSVGDSDSHTLDILDPSVSLAKQCSPDPVQVGEVIEWTITVTNAGNMDLDCLVNDPTAGVVDEPVSVAVGESAPVTASQTVLEPGTISNTATVDCPIEGLDNVIGDEAEADCEAFEPSPLVCRTPGFWGTHAGDDHRSGQATNLVELVIDAAGGALSVCGATISDTDVGSVNSAIEAMCVAVQGVQQRQLARQLTAMALNCVVSGGNADCTDTVEDVESLFALANAACEIGGGGPELGPWIDQVDCFNNGGQFVDGECLIDGEDPNNCQNRDLDESSDIFDLVSPLPGPAGSPRACSAATNNGIKVVPAS